MRELVEVVGGIGRETSQSSSQVEVSLPEGEDWDNQETDDFLSRGVAAYQQGDYETAANLLQQATELNSQSFQAWEKYGVVLQQLGRYTEAIEANNQALQISGKTQNIEEVINTNLSNTVNTFNLSQSSVLFRPPIIQTSMSSEAEYDSQAVELFNQGLNKAQAGDFLAAIQLYTKVIEINPDLYLAYDNRGLALRDLGKYEEAITDFTKAIDIQPDDYQAYNGRGATLSDLGRYEEAIADFTQAIQIKPDFYQAYDNRGAVLCDHLGKYKEAIADFERVLEIQPEKFSAWRNRGVALENSGNYKTAIANWDEGLTKLNPKDKEYQLGCGTLHWMKGNAHYRQATNHYQYPLYQEALESYHQALDFLKDNPRNRETYLEVLKGLIKTYRATRDEEEAKTYENIAVNLLEKLLNETSPGYKIVLLRKFSGFFQLRVDRLARSQDIAKQKEALELAEARKNISLAWLQGKSNNKLPIIWLLIREIDIIAGILFLHQIPSPNYEEMQQIWPQLLPQTAIIYWHLSPVSLTTFLLLENHFQTFTTDLSPILSEVELRKVDSKDNLENWLTNWKQTYSNYSKAENSNAWRETLPQQLEKLAHFLSIPTLQETLQTLQVKNLILIPHRDLHLLPLHALFPTSYTFSYLPSIKQGIGTSSEKETREKELTNLLSVESPEGKTSSLWFTPVEAKVIASFYHNSESLQKKEDVTTALINNPGDFLFTGHGYHNFTQPEKSALFLVDGELTVEEIFKLEFPPRHLVTLSACETGLTGDKELIDEFVSLGSAFLAKGASYIITSLWRVDERATAILLMRFHQLLRDRGTVVAFNEAVNWLRDLDQGSLANWYRQLAQELERRGKIEYADFVEGLVETIEDEGNLTCPYRHPYYWAGFTITGI